MIGLLKQSSWDRNISRISDASGWIPDLLEPYEFVSDHSFITKSGYPVVVLDVDPVPYECLDSVTLAKHAGAFRSALRVLYPEMRVYQYLQKRKLLDPEEIHSSRMQHVSRSMEGPLFYIRSNVAICYEFERAEKLRFDPLKGAALVDLETQINVRVLEELASSFIHAIGSFVKMRLADRQGAFRFLRSLVNYDPLLEDSRLIFPWSLNEQMVSSSLDARSKVLRVGGYFARMMTMRNAPPSVEKKDGEIDGGTTNGLLTGLLEVPANMNVCIEWVRDKAGQTSKEIQSRREHYQITKRSLFLPSTSANPDLYRELLVDGAAQRDIDDLTEAQAEMRRMKFGGKVSLTCVVYGETDSEVRSGYTKAKEVFDSLSIQTVDHNGRLALANLLSTIPGGSEWSSRGVKGMTDENLADMCLLYGPACGDPWNAHLDGPALSQFKTNQNTVFNFNFHKGQAGHGVVTGDIRSGKTYFIKSCVKSCDEQYSPYIVVLDVASSFEGLIKSLGGSYVQLGGSEAAINPFAGPSTKRNLDFRNRFVRMLIESDGAGSLNAEETEDVNREVLEMDSLDAKYRRLGYLRLDPGTLAPRLARWQRRDQVGQYAHLFDNETDSIEESRIQGFSFPSMDHDREAFSALLFYALHRSLEWIYSTDRPAFVFMDEAATFLRIPSILEYVLDALRRWPKMNASLIMVLHSISDTTREFALVISEKCATRVHFPNHGIDKKDWMDTFQLSEAEVDRIVDLRPQRQFLVQGQGVCNLIVSPEEHEVLKTGMEKAIA